MSNVSVETITYEPWGNALRLTNGSIELIASLDFGPRIIRFGYVGGQNLFLEDQEGKHVNRNPAIDRLGEGHWRIYGGHRLWTSPESEPRTTYPDNAAVEWKKLENGFVLSSPVENWTQMRKEISVRMNPATGEVTVDHLVENTGAWPVQFAPWALSVMAPGGTAIVPQVRRQTGLLPNRIISLWPYSKMNDPRVTWGEKYIVVRQGDGETPFKFGSSNEAGLAAYQLGEDLFIKRYQHVAGGTYPDFGVSFECYVCGDFLEVETLGELQTVQPGASAVHQELWSLTNAKPLPFDNEELLESEMNKLFQL
jgi:hypothetical protein